MSLPADLSILPATPSDVPAILGFIRELAEFEHLSHEMLATEDHLREHLFGPKPAAEAIIARLAGQPVGYALFFTTYSTFTGLPGIWLEDLYVTAKHRRAGIGGRLLRELAGITLARKCGRLEWSVLDWNEPAVKLYKKLGAVAMTDWTIQRVTGDSLRKLSETP